MDVAAAKRGSRRVTWNPWLIVAIVALIVMLLAGLALGDVFEIHQNGASL